MTDEEAQQEALRFLNRLDDVNKVTIIQDNIILADDMLIYVIHDCSLLNDDVIVRGEQKLKETLSILKNNLLDMPSCIYLFVMLIRQLTPNEYRQLTSNESVVSLTNVGVEDI